MATSNPLLAFGKSCIEAAIEFEKFRDAMTRAIPFNSENIAIAKKDLFSMGIRYNSIEGQTYRALRGWMG